MDTRENFKRTTLRLPTDLYDRLERAAGKAKSVNAVIIEALEEKYPDPDASLRAAFSELMDRDAAIWSIIEPLIRIQQTLPEGDERSTITEQLKGLFEQSSALTATMRDLLLKADADETNPRSSAYRAKNKQISP